MGTIRDPVFDTWWPLCQSLLLVRASICDTAKALEADGERLRELCGREFQYEWVKRSSIGDLFRNVRAFPNFPTRHYAMPTTGPWTVIWNNSALCTGHDSQAHCLTNFWGLETFHFYSSDKRSTQLAGTHFTHRVRAQNGTLSERDVYCCDQGSRWHFAQRGEPLSAENVGSYDAKRKRERLNEQRLTELLNRLGIHPWRESSYDFAQMCFCITDAKNHEDLAGLDFKAIRSKLSNDGTHEDDHEIEGPPDYLRARCRMPNPEGPARLLLDGSWCGHGEAQFWIYDVAIQASDLVSVRLPANGSSAAVQVIVEGSDPIEVYDCRYHPASAYSETSAEPLFQSPYCCQSCGTTRFRAAVGFEVPVDCQSQNDTSWFALAVECSSCGLAAVVYQDETA